MDGKNSNDDIIDIDIPVDEMLKVRKYSIGES